MQISRPSAVFYFLSGFLFSADAFELYEGLYQPVWIAYGVRGDFTDYRVEGVPVKQGQREW